MDAASSSSLVRPRGLQAERRGSALVTASRVLPPHWNLTERWRARARLSLPTGHLKWCRVKTGRGRSRSPNRLASGERDGARADSRRERRSSAPYSTPNGKLCDNGCGEIYSPGADPRLAGRAPGQCAWRCCARLAAALESDRALARALARGHPQDTTNDARGHEVAGGCCNGWLLHRRDRVKLMVCHK